MVDLQERGLRNPHHGFAVVTGSRLLQPVFAAPARPMETIVGWRLQLDAMVTQMLRMPWCPPITVEFGAWKVPVSTLGDYFTDLFVADFEDESDAVATARLIEGSGVPHAGTPVSAQGPNSGSALHSRTRHWAGELGTTSASATFDTARAFTPYVSAATYHVARSFYELELELGNSSPSSIGGFTRIDDDLWQTPPVISEYYRSMTGTAMGATASAVIPTTNLAGWAERISLLSRPNRTYREYLQGFGVPDSRIATLPEPLMLLRRRLRPMDAKLIGNVVPVSTDQTGVGERYGFGKWASNHTQTGTTFTQAGDSNLSAYMSRIDETRKRRLMIDEPSIILGTVCFQVMNTTQQNFAAHMDINRLISGALWGDANSDEADFIHAQDLASTSGMSSIPGRPQGTEVIYSGTNEDGVGPPYVMNALNLFLNGDVFTNDVFAFQPYGPGGNLQQTVPPGTLTVGELSEVSGELQFTATGDFSMGVATDLVS